MTLCKRIVPVVLCSGKTAYKGRQFNAMERSIGSVVSVVQVHARRGVDELCILDVTATKEGRGPDLDMIREITEGCFIPVTVGGGIKTLEDIDRLLRAGADKVAIGHEARNGQFYWHQENFGPLLDQAWRRFGRQALVAVMDVGPQVDDPDDLGSTVSYIQPSFAVMRAQGLENFGAGEILLQSIDRDGMMTGYDLDLIREVSSAVSIPVIASCGCGEPKHMLEAFQAGADACAAGAMFAFSDTTPKDCAKFLKANGLPVRL